MFVVDNLKLRRNTWIRSANIPPHLIGWELEDCVDISDDIINTVAGWLHEVSTGKIISNISSKNCGKGLAFYGHPGRGKTTLAAAALQEAMRVFPQDVFSINDVRPCYFITYASLLDLKGQTMEDDADERTISLFAGIMGEHPNEHKNVKILLLDDVGREHASSSGWNKSLLHHVLRSRFYKGLPTIVTSNILQGKWAEWYGEATGSFTHEAFTNIELESEKGDLRQL